MNETQVTFVRHLLDQHPHWFEETGRMDLAQMSNRNYPYSMMFSPIQINRLTLKNRIVMGPKGERPALCSAPTTTDSSTPGSQEPGVSIPKAGWLMNTRPFWPRVMCLTGLGMITMAVAALGPTWKADMSGWLREVLSVAIVYFPLSASGIVALGAFLTKNRYRRSIAVALLLTIFGLVAVSRFSGVDLGLGLMLGVYAYLAGVTLTCVGAILVIVESFRSPPKIVRDSIDVAR